MGSLAIVLSKNRISKALIGLSSQVCLCKNPYLIYLFQSDLILCLCSYDIRVADKAASLWHDGLANVILFSGNSGKLTEGISVYSLI